MARHRSSAWLAAFGLLLVAGCSGHTPSPAGSAAAAPGQLLVLAGGAAPEWHRLLRASGAWSGVGGIGDLPGAAAAVAPSGAVTSAQTAALLRWVRGGGRIATSDPGLLAALGVHEGAATTTQGASDGTLSGLVHWQEPVQVYPLQVRVDDRVLARSSDGAALAAELPVGSGSVLALGVDPLAPQRAGYELLPQLGRQIAAWSGAAFGPERAAAAVYLDPGGLHGGAAGTPEQIADRLVGVRAVYIAGWNADFTAARDDYDYAALIAALHARGILAYAWLEPPFVSLRLWEQHPECRERTQSGRDAHVDWRLLMTLEDPRCYALAWQVWSRLLTAFDWDGVDVAELYFEPATPDGQSTPFSKAALAQFGGSPEADPAWFQQFRMQLVTRLTSKLLGDLNGLASRRPLDLELTTVDDAVDPSFAAELGVSDIALAAVARAAGAALQVEDPYPLWGTSPLRYTRIAAAVAAATAPGGAAVDLNVVPRTPAFPTAAMTGAELDLATSAAAGPTGRVAFYALGTLTAADLAHLPAALGGAAGTLPGRVDAPWPVTLPAPGPAFGRLIVDGVDWPVGAGKALLPAGPHTVRWVAGSAAGAVGLTSLTAELGTAGRTAGSTTFTYSARAPALAVLTRSVVATVDGGPLAISAQQPDPAGGAVLRLPPGRHTVTVRAR
ncbi:MAG: hypothetical protein NVS3B26_16710 [Mycobacteriales bacterium]